MIRPDALLAATLAVGACGIDIRHRPEMRWVGTLTPTTNPATCPTTRGILTMRSANVSFTPEEGVWVLTGTAGPETLAATQSRVTSDHKTYKTDLQAHWTEHSVQGTYTTPRCAYRVDLSRF